MLLHLPSSVSLAYLALFDPNNPQNGWTTVAGPFSGSTPDFIGPAQPITLSANTTYGFAMFTVSSALPTPTPGPTASSLPSPTPTPSGTACTSTSSAGRLAARGAGGVIPNQLYVTYRQNVAGGSRAVDALAGAQHGVDLAPSNGLGHRAITLAPGADAALVGGRLKANPNIVSVAAVHERSALSGQVNDPLFDNVDQWYLFKTDVTPDGWSHAPDGTGVAIAVIDTGVDETNTDLAPKIDFRERVIGGIVVVGSAASGDATVQDTNGHGTNVAGIAASTTNNGYGFAGAGYNARLMIFKIFPDATATSDCQSASTADEARAVADAVSNGASVISLSLGAPPSGGFDQAEHDAIEAAITAGVTVVAAGGNDSSSTPDYPGGYPGVIAVGASNVNDNGGGAYAGIVSEGVASYSNSGVTLVAPGGDPSSGSDVDILHWIENYSTTTAAFPPDRCSNSGGVCRALFAGTSQATPQVSGTVALMMAYHGGPRSLTPATVAGLLTSTADNIGVTAARMGAGRMNAGSAVAAAHP